MILVLDCGNSRLHWGLADAGRWVALGGVRNQEIGTLALREWQNLPRPTRVMGANVAGEATRVRVEAQLLRWRVAPEWLIATEGACGLRSRYALPSQLGADRWAALIGARVRLAAELLPMPCVVVTARTVVSIDGIDADGVFVGGIVVPGLNLMMQSIAASTFTYRISPGRFHDLPINNADALYSGAIQALCAAIEQMRAKLGAGGSLPKCMLAGGAAAEIVPHLNAPVEVVDNLVLEGALALAETT